MQFKKEISLTFVFATIEKSSPFKNIDKSVHISTVIHYTMVIVICSAKTPNCI